MAKHRVTAAPFTTDAVLKVMHQHINPSVGLVFIPPVVAHFTEQIGSGVPSVREVWDKLLTLSRAGRIELRPEGGLNRLSSYQLYLAPPGPQKTRLTWARLL